MGRHTYTHTHILMEVYFRGDFPKRSNKCPRRKSKDSLGGSKNLLIRISSEGILRPPPYKELLFRYS